MLMVCFKKQVDFIASALQSCNLVPILFHLYACLLLVLLFIVLLMKLHLLLRWIVLIDLFLLMPSINLQMLTDDVNSGICS